MLSAPHEAKERQPEPGHRLQGGAARLLTEGEADRSSRGEQPTREGDLGGSGFLAEERFEGRSVLRRIAQEMPGSPGSRSDAVSEVVEDLGGDLLGGLGGHG